MPEPGLCRRRGRASLCVWGYVRESADLMFTEHLLGLRHWGFKKEPDPICALTFQGKTEGPTG